MTAIYGFNNTVTASGAYTLFPVIYIPGIVSSGGASVIFTGPNVFASVDTPKSLLNLLSGFSITASNGASVTIGSSSAGLISALSGSTIVADGGTISVGGAAIGALTKTSYSIDNGGTLRITAAQSNAAISALAGSSVAFGSAGGTLVVQPGENLKLISFSSITGFEYGNAVIEIPGATSVVKAVEYFGNTAITFDNGLQMIVSGNFYNYTVQKNLWQYSDGQNVYIRSAPPQSPASRQAYVLVCYLRDSKVHTRNGDVNVQDLRVGDQVVAEDADGLSYETPVIWTGRAYHKVSPDGPDDVVGFPIRIKAHAIGENMPNADLLVTPDHCLYLDKAFIPVRMLVNGSNIFYDRTITEFEYYHFETPRHAIVRVNNALSESYLDTGHRSRFSTQDWLATVCREPAKKAWGLDSAAPLSVDRKTVETVHARLSAKASLGAPAADVSKAVHGDDRLPEANFCVETDRGQKLHLRRRDAKWHIFELPSGTDKIYLQSRTIRPCDAIGPFIDDRRQLGVLVGAVAVYHANGRDTISHHFEAEILDGWANIESASCRWTAGRACLALTPGGWSFTTILAVEILSHGHYLPE